MKRADILTLFDERRFMQVSYSYHVNINNV